MAYGLRFPDFAVDCELVALSQPGEYPIDRGRLVSTRGLDIAVADYDQHFVEEHVPWSNALHARLRERGSYLVGPLARYATSAGELSPVAAEAAAAAGLEPSERNLTAWWFATHPKPVRDAIERHRAGLDADSRRYLMRRDFKVIEVRRDKKNPDELAYAQIVESDDKPAILKPEEYTRGLEVFNI